MIVLNNYHRIRALWEDFQYYGIPNFDACKYSSPHKTISPTNTIFSVNNAKYSCEIFLLNISDKNTCKYTQILRKIYIRQRNRNYNTFLPDEITTALTCIPNGLKFKWTQVIYVIKIPCTFGSDNFKIESAITTKLQNTGDGTQKLITLSFLTLDIPNYTSNFTWTI